MRFSYFSLFFVTSTVFASPAPRPQGKGTGADSCPSDPLSIDTWTKLSIDENLLNLTARNVQDLASSFGSPNFFCGLDSFCNAGQPCLPIQLPNWYIAVAIQNWNNYMNSLNTAITFASSIISLKLPEIVADVFPDPVDNVTPLKNLGNMFGTALGFIPFTGPLATSVLGIQQGITFVTEHAKPPAPTDKFLAWSNIASSVAEIVTEYQNIISTAITTTLDAPVQDPTNGIFPLIKGGGFLGVSRNFTQSDVSKAAIDTVSKTAISLVLQAQKMFILRVKGDTRDCTGRKENIAFLCIDAGDGTFTSFSLIQADDQDNSVLKNDIAQVLIDKHGFTQQTLLKGPADCLDESGGKQLTNRFEQGILTKQDDVCAFTILVCDLRIPAPIPLIGNVPRCRENGIDV